MKAGSSRRKLVRHRAKTAGAAPGTLIHDGEIKQAQVRITLIEYSEDGYDERQIKSIDQFLDKSDWSKVRWINVDGLNDVNLIAGLGEVFGLHPLLLEDVLNTVQRPKLEDYDNCGFVVLRMLSCNGQDGSVEGEQISMVVGKDFVISFQEHEGDVLDSLRYRLRNAKGRVRKMGADYLAYAIMDCIVDGYFSVIESFGDKIEILEDQLSGDPNHETLQKIHAAKRDLISLRRAVWPVRELVTAMQRTESRFIGPEVAVYLRDVYDHAVQIIDTVESLRDLVAGMMELYLSVVSNRMNSIMKVLTIIATIFIPLTFVAGIYGMNFKYMPELEWRWGYPLVLLVMAVVAGGMLAYFRKKKWL